MLHSYRNWIVAPAFALTASFGLATADAASYELGGGSYVNANQGHPGLLIETDVYDLDGLSFDLNDGESYTFDFFDIWTPETGVGPDDQMSQSITAYLDFEVPSELVEIDGDTEGVSDWTWFIIPINFQYGEVNWDGPVVVSHAGGEFEISLSEGIFNYGKYGLTEGQCYGTTIQATITQISSQVVPTPSAAAAGLALAGLGMLRRRRMA